MSFAPCLLPPCLCSLECRHARPSSIRVRLSKSTELLRKVSKCPKLSRAFLATPSRCAPARHLQHPLPCYMASVQYCMHACMHVRSLLMCVAVGRRCRHCVSGSRWTHLVLYSQQRETRRAYPGGAIHASRPLACTCLPMRTDWLNAARLIKLPECLCVTSRTQACF